MNFSSNSIFICIITFIIDLLDCKSIQQISRTRLGPCPTGSTKLSTSSQGNGVTSLTSSEVELEGSGGGEGPHCLGWNMESGLQSDKFEFLGLGGNDKFDATEVIGSGAVVASGLATESAVGHISSILGSNNQTPLLNSGGTIASVDTLGTTTGDSNAIGTGVHNSGLMSNVNGSGSGMALIPHPTTDEPIKKKPQKQKPKPQKSKFCLFSGFCVGLGKK